MEIKFYKKKVIKLKQQKEKIKMEEKPTTDTPTLQTSASDWRIKHNLYQTYRNHRQLQNRISILQLQKKKKLKDIENKLNQHKRFVQSKIYKYQLKQAIGNKVNSQLQRSSSNSRVFKAQRESRSLNIKRQQDDLFMTRHKMFQQTKQSRIQNEKKILLNKLTHLQEKVKKRNRVRLIEIQSKQNIQSYWNNRLQAFQQDKRLDISMKIKQQEDKMKQLQEMEKNEESLLEQIRKAEQVEMDLSRMIDAEKSLPGGKLNDLYASKVSNVADETQ